MAKSISAEELQLRKRARRRLIGAIALVTIVAVFLPMALEHEPRPLNQDISIQIPSPNSNAFTSKIAPVVQDAKSVAKPASGTPVQSDAPAKDGAPAVAAAAATNAENPNGVDQARPDAKSAVAYVVQVAALNDADKAKQMQEQIAVAGVKSYIETVPTKKGTVTRVRAGPFATRDEAERTRDKLKGMGLNGNLVPK